MKRATETEREVLLVARAQSLPIARRRAEQYARHLPVRLWAFDEHPRAPLPGASLIALHDLDATIGHALDRSLDLVDAHIVAFADSTLDPAIGRWLARDPRAVWVLRTPSQLRRTEQRLGLSLPRAQVIPLYAETGTPLHPSLRCRVLFPRPVDDRREHAVDLFVHTVRLLAEWPGFERLTFTIHGVGPPNETLLRPLARFSNVHVADSTLPPPPCGIALLPFRSPDQELPATLAAAAGMAIVGTLLPGVEEWLPTDAGTFARAEDPAALAALVRSLAEDETRFARAAKRSCEFAAEHFAAERSIVKEIELLHRLAGEVPRRTPRAVPRAAHPLLTVAVPAWNTSAYLPRCVSSLARCAPPGTLEVLVIDDGSTDETPVVAGALAERWPEAVRVITQTNLGHGGAINTALREASGRYFRVVDSDDWVATAAFGEQLEKLRHESTDVLLTDYSEAWADEALPRPVRLFERLVPGQAVGYETLVDPGGGLTSWGPILSTATVRTELLRASGLRLTERSAYVDIEYCTMGLAHTTTLKYLGLDIYRYTLGREGQTASDTHHRAHYRQHEQVIFRVCAWLADAELPPGLHTYLVERVLTPVTEKHLQILEEVLRDDAQARAFRSSLQRWPFLAGMPTLAQPTLPIQAKRALKRALPEGFISGAKGATRGPLSVVRSVGRALGLSRPKRR